MPNEQGEFESGIKKSGIAVAVALLLAGCATPTVVQSVQPNDGQLNCEELQKALTEAEKLGNEAEGKRGSTGGNVVKGLLFFPALLVSNANVSDAIKAAEARKTHLTGLMSQKNCKVAPPKEPAKGAK